MGFSGGANGKEPAFQCRKHKRHKFDPWVGKILGEGHGNLPQYSCLENPWTKEPGGLQSPCGHKEADTTERLSTPSFYILKASHIMLLALIFHIQLH